MRGTYQIAEGRSNTSSRELARFLAKEGQMLLPMVELIEQAECAVDDLVDVMGRATIEAIVRMSAEVVAGPRQQGRKSDRDVYWHGSQPGRVALRERQLRIEKPRLRKKKPKRGDTAEVEIPLYEACKEPGRPAKLADEALRGGGDAAEALKVFPADADRVTFNHLKRDPKTGTFRADPPDASDPAFVEITVQAPLDRYDVVSLRFSADAGTQSRIQWQLDG